MEKPLQLADNTSCVVLGGSSMTTLNTDGTVQKVNFYPQTVAEYIAGLVDAGLTYGKLKKDSKGVFLLAIPGAVQNEGEIVTLSPNFQKVKDDAEQRGMPNLFFNKLIKEELEKRGYDKIEVYGYNDAAPALLATICQDNTESVLKEFENSNPNNILTKADYAIKYIINGTGTGEATINPDNHKMTIAEKGHLKPNILWYELNPFFKYITKYSIIGENRSIERLIAGGPTGRTPRHFGKILRAIFEILQDKNHEDVDTLAEYLGFKDYQELLTADSTKLLTHDYSDSNNSILQVLGQHIQKNNKLALIFRDIFARAIGTSIAFMHYVIGEMPDAPLHTFVGARDIRHSALSFIRTDGSTTALLGDDTEVWNILNQASKDYAYAILNKSQSNTAIKANAVNFKVLNINKVFPDIHPDFGGLPALAQKKLNNMLI